MYFGLCYSIAEMSPALPHTGGAYSFARSAMGPWGGFATGVAETIEYVVTPAVIVVGIGGYMNSISDDLFGFTLSQPVWWLIFYAIFVGLNFVGVEVASFRFTVFICFLSLAILAVFFIGALTKLDFTGAGRSTPNGRPLVHRRRAAASSTRCRSRSGSTSRSRSCRWPPRSPPTPSATSPADDLGAPHAHRHRLPGAVPQLRHRARRDGRSATSAEPLLDGLKTIFGSGTSASLLGLVAVAGLVASFHTIIFAYGRNIFSLSRAGYYPHGLSVTHGEPQDPARGADPRRRARLGSPPTSVYKNTGSQSSARRCSTWRCSAR